MLVVFLKNILARKQLIGGDILKWIVSIDNNEEFFIEDDKSIFKGYVGESFLDFISIDFYSLEADVNNIINVLSNKRLSFHVILENLRNFLRNKHFYFNDFPNFENMEDHLSIELSFYYRMLDINNPNANSRIQKLKGEVNKFIIGKSHIIKRIIDECTENKSFIHENYSVMNDIGFPKVGVQPNREYDNYLEEHKLYMSWGDSKSIVTADNVIDILSNMRSLKEKTDEYLEYGIYNLDFLFGTLVDILYKSNAIINKCKNCNKYFIPLNRSDTMYCNRVSIQDKTKTCGEYVKYQKQLERERNNESGKIYKSIYTMKLNKFNTAKNYESEKLYKHELDLFMDEASNWKSDVKMGIKTEREYIEWLNSFKKRGLKNGKHNKER